MKPMTSILFALTAALFMLSLVHAADMKTDHMGMEKKMEMKKDGMHDEMKKDGMHDEMKKDGMHDEMKKDGMHDEMKKDGMHDEMKKDGMKKMKY